MSAFAAECEAARARLQEITLAVCGHCLKSCCHHGTMLGSADIPRLHKGLLLSGEFRERVQRGLRGRAQELRSDLQELQAAAERALGRPLGEAPAVSADHAMVGAMRTGVEAAQPASPHLPRSPLALAMAAWREYADYLASCDVTDADALGRLRLYSAVRANAFRALRAIPGGIEALARIGAQRPSLRFRGERMPTERCVLHYDGCLAEQWKPAKCANFFCPADPGLVEAVHLAMGFTEFLMANVERIPQARLLEMLRLEAALGAPYMTPKVLFGPGRLTDHIGRTLKAESLYPVVHPRVPQLMMSSHEVVQLLERAPEHMPQITLCGTLQGAALYEIGLGVQQAERKGVLRPWYVVAEQLQRRAVLPHPLWQDRIMAQPVGALEAYVVDPE